MALPDNVSHAPYVLSTMRQIEELLEEPSSFRDWLEEQPDRAVVGERGRADACPLARFLYDRTDVRSPWLAVGAVYVSTAPNDRVPTPSWATSFIERVDREKRGLGIQARTARRYLREVIGK